MKSLHLSLATIAIATPTLLGCSLRPDISFTDSRPDIVQSQSCGSPSVGSRVPNPNPVSPANWGELITRLNANKALAVAFDSSTGAVIVRLNKQSRPGLAVRFVGKTRAGDEAMACPDAQLKELIGEVYALTSDMDLTRLPVRRLAEERWTTELSRLFSHLCETGICPSTSSSLESNSLLRQAQNTAAAMKKNGHGIFFAANSVNDKYSLLGIELYDVDTFLVWIYFMQTVKTE
jgi:hypothetical protein